MRPQCLGSMVMCVAELHTILPDALALALVSALGILYLPLKKLNRETLQQDTFTARKLFQLAFVSNQNRFVICTALNGTQQDNTEGLRSLRIESNVALDLGRY